MSFKKFFEEQLSVIMRPFLKPRVYIDDYNGITAHLETLSLAFAIHRAYGHEIVLDWRELDALRVEETTIGRVGPAAKIGAVRVRQCDDQTFRTLKDRKRIICRSEYGPSSVLDPVYMDVAKKVKIRADLADQIIRTFDPVRNYPVVGLHIRRGDFALATEEIYDPTATLYPAVPLWWYEKMMDALLKYQKDVKFFMSANGDSATYNGLRRHFDIITLEVPSPYDWKGPGHHSEVHPVADLFALACCPVILATPVSNFSHWAANVLGAPSEALIPLKGAGRDNPITGVLSLYGRRLNVWREVCRGDNSEAVKIFNIEDPPPVMPAGTDWLADVKKDF